MQHDALAHTALQVGDLLRDAPHCAPFQDPGLLRDSCVTGRAYYEL